MFVVRCIGFRLASSPTSFAKNLASSLPSPETALPHLNALSKKALAEWTSATVDAFNLITMAVYKVNAEGLVPLEATSFEREGIRERLDLQRLLRSKIDILAPDTLLIAEEFGYWDEGRRRIGPGG